MRNSILESLPVREGHFRFESGHHGNLWLDLEMLYLRPNRIRPLAVELAGKLKPFEVDVVCSPLVEGAFVGLTVASELDVRFVYTMPVTTSISPKDLFPVRYVLSKSLFDHVHGKSVAIVNDVINAGSAVKGTYASLTEFGARPVAVGSLLVLGAAAAIFSNANSLELRTLEHRRSRLWPPEECPLCAKGIALDGAS